MFIDATLGVPEPDDLAAAAISDARGGSDIVVAFLRRWEQGPERLAAPRRAT